MPTLPLKFDEPLWPDVTQEHVDAGRLIFLQGHGMEMGMLHAGTVAGSPTVAVRINLPDGRVVIAETTLALFLFAADMFKARAAMARPGAVS